MCIVRYDTMVMASLIWDGRQNAMIDELSSAIIEFQTCADVSRLAGGMFLLRRAKIPNLQARRAATEATVPVHPIEHFWKLMQALLSAVFTDHSRFSRTCENIAWSFAPASRPNPSLACLTTPPILS